MKNIIEPKGSRLPGRTRRKASALVVAAALAGPAGIVAGQARPALALGTRPAAYSPVEAKFSHAELTHGRLTIRGTGASDKIALRLQAGRPDVLQVDVGDDGSADFSFARAAVARIAIEARAGDDLVRIDEGNGAVNATIPTTIDGGSGRDTLAGGSGAETLRGGRGNDSIDGNAGNEVAIMGTGADVFVWDPGDGSDVVEGRGGTDTMLFNGAGIPERVDLSANGERLRFVRDVGAITMDTAGVERVDFPALDGADVVTVNDLTGTDVTEVNVDLAETLGGSAGDGELDQVIVNGTGGKDAIDVSGDAGGVKVSGLAAAVSIQHHEPTDRLAVNGRGGDDAISAAALAAGAIALAVDGGSGRDTLAGGSGAETLRGGRGSDSIDGNVGNDVAFMGSGADVFVWDPGDGSDVVEGQFGADTMLFNGADIAEQIDLSANGGRLRFFRVHGAITMDTNGVERVDFPALDGADVVTVNDLTGTDVTEVNVDLAETLGGSAGDGELDQVIVNGTGGRDAIDVSGDASGVKVSGLAAAVSIQHHEPTDRLAINTLAGTDTVDSGGLAARVIQLFVDGVLVP